MAHLHDLRSEVDDEALVDRFAADWRTCGLDDATLGLLEYAVKLTESPATCGEDDIAALHALGWDDPAISDAIEVCAFFNYINRIAEGMGVDPESWLGPDGRPLESPDSPA